jgi:signal transduction histidine kinase
VRVRLDTALRHPPAGGTIRMGSAIMGRTVQITVQDDGPGISPDHLAHIFERFYQIPNLDDRRGNGLGLSIAKSLVNAMGGKIRLESSPGTGTRVTFAVPAVPVGTGK